MTDMTVNEMLQAASDAIDEISFEISCDRDDTSYHAMPTEWYNERIERLRTAKIYTVDTDTTIGLRFDSTGNASSDAELFVGLEVGTQDLAHRVPVEVTDCSIIYPK